MRSILQELFPYIVLLYLIDSFIYIKRHQVLFVSQLGGTFRLKKAGFHIVGLLPISQTVISHYVPLCFSGNGMYILTEEALHENRLYEEEDFRFISYQDINEAMADGEGIKINGMQLMTAPSAIAAKNIAGLIHDLKNLKPSERPQKIRNILADAMDLIELKAIRRRQEKLFFYVDVLGSVLFTYTFMILPWALYATLGEYISVQLLLASIGVIHLLIILVTFFGLRNLPKVEVGFRMITLFSIILFPPSAIHVLNNLTRNLYGQFDYLTIAGGLLPADTFKYLVGRELRRIIYLKAKGNNDDLKEFWGMKEHSLHGLIDQAGVSLEEIQAVPEKKDKSAVSYCPYCLSEFIGGFAGCSDCGVELKEFE